MVDQHAIAAVRQVERNVLVSLLAGGTAVGVPYVHDLAVLDQRSEALAEPVDELAHAQGQLFMNVGGGPAPMLGGGQAGAIDDTAGRLEVRRNFQVADGLVPARCHGATLHAERQAPRCACCHGLRELPTSSKKGGEWAGEASRRSAAEPGWVVAVRSSACVRQAAGCRVTL